MRTLGRWLLATIVLLVSRRRRTRSVRDERPRIVAAPSPAPRAELAVIALLGLATLAALAFVAIYAIDAFEADTQLLGLALALAFACCSVALLVTAKLVLPHEEEPEPYPRPEHEHHVERAEAVQIADEGRQALTRRRLLALSAGSAAGAVGLALVTPVASLGPFLEENVLRRSPWRRGVRLVNSDGEPLRASALDDRSLVTAFPEHGPKNAVAAPLVVVRLDLDDLQLPPERSNWAPDGILAYSKICTHAGCAVSLFRTPNYEPAQPGPALVCPCHYSTFNPATGGTVEFGPAGRSLPQLPLEIDADGFLVAAGPFSGPVGPSWSGVRRS